MAERSTTEARQRRSDARERRRSLASQPFEAVDEAARGGDEGGAQNRGDRRLRQAVLRAAAGAVAAGIAAAAKTLFDRLSASKKAVREPNAGEPEATGESEPKARTENEEPPTPTEEPPDDRPPR